MDPYDLLAQAGKVFAHPTRLRILDILAREEACVCHITHILKQRQAHVSQHLRVLRDAQMVTDRKDGLMVYYRLADARAAAIVSLLRDLLLRSGPAIPFALLPTAPVAGCPCPHCASDGADQRS